MCDGTRRKAFSFCASGVEYGTAADGDAMMPGLGMLLRATSTAAAANRFRAVLRIAVLALVLGQRHSIVSVERAIQLPG
jgi:hypothetical protein